MLAKGKVLGWRGGSRADGGWKYLPQAPGCCLSTISKGANVENSSGEILVLGRRLSYCLWKTPSRFRSQHSRSDETGSQKVIHVNPLPSWNYSVSELHENLNTMQFTLYPRHPLSSYVLKYVYIPVKCVGVCRIVCLNVNKWCCAVELMLFFLSPHHVAVSTKIDM